MPSVAVKKANLTGAIKAVEANKFTVVSTYMLSDHGISILRNKYLVADTGKFSGSAGSMLLVCKQ